MPEDRGENAGLSGRGWGVLVGAVGAVAVVLLVVAVSVWASGAGHARAAQASSMRVSPVPTASATSVPTASAPASAVPSPSAPEEPVTAIAVGACLQTFVSEWESTYPVVPCDQPHVAQLLTSGALPQPKGAAYPGASALGAQVGTICSNPALLDWGWVQNWGDDVQLAPRFPATSVRWQSGARAYYCFVYTHARHQYTGTALSGG